MTNIRKNWRNRKGSALMIAMGMVLLVGATTSSLFYQGLTHSKFGERSLAQTRAMELANSGLELARYTLRHSASDCFSTEINKHIIFDQIPLGQDGHFTVEVLATPNNPYTARVISTGIYNPISTTAKVEAKMTCGFLNALDSYTILTAGDLFVTGSITTEKSGDYTYNQIHADGSVTLFGNAEIPPGGLTVTQADPIVTAPPQGVNITHTETTSGMPDVSAGTFTEQMNKFYPENKAPSYTFHDDGSVTDGSNNVVMQASGSTQVFMGISYTPPPKGATATWSITKPGSMDSNTTYVIENADLHVDAAVGSELNPSTITLVVKKGNLDAKESISLAKQHDMGNSIARPVGVLVDGTSKFHHDVFLKDATIINGGSVSVEGQLILNNGALITGDDTQLNSVSFQHPYDGAPVNYNAKSYGNLLEMDGKLRQYAFKGLGQQTS